MPPKPTDIRLDDLPREIELILHCARTRMDPERGSRVRTLVQKGIDWDYLTRTADQHGLLPLTYWQLRTLCAEAVPTIVMKDLRDRFNQNAQRNLFMAGELRSLIRLFQSSGITAVPFKGPTLAVAAYGNLALRVFGDLDILVHKHDVKRAKSLLISLGYRPQFLLNDIQEAIYLQSNCEYNFLHKQRGSIVELHWGFDRRFLGTQFEPSELWNRLQTTSIIGTEFRTFSSNDLLLYLCIHGAKHTWERLECVSDIAELIRSHENLNWQWLMNQATTLGARRMLVLGLLLAHDLLGVALPGQVVRQIHADSVSAGLASEVRARLISEPEGRPQILGPYLAGASFQLRMRERLRDKLRYCLGLVLTPSTEDWDLLEHRVTPPLPTPLAFLYYPLRPARLTWRYSTRLWSHYGSRRGR